MSTKHTPGPWTVINGKKYFPTVVMAEVEVPEHDIGTLHYPAPHININASHNQKMESIMANAKLIAAAPELLENLIRIVERVEENGLQTSFPSAYERAKKAIKKAIE